MTLTKLRDLRIKNDFTQEHMGKIIGITKVGYWKIEKGETPLSYDRAVKLASIFGMKPDDIFLSDELTKTEHISSTAEEVSV